LKAVAGSARRWGKEVAEWLVQADVQASREPSGSEIAQGQMGQTDVNQAGRDNDTKARESLRIGQSWKKITSEESETSDISRTGSEIIGLYQHG